MGKAVCVRFVNDGFFIRTAYHPPQRYYLPVIVMGQQVLERWKEGQAWWVGQRQGPIRLLAMGGRCQGHEWEVPGPWVGVTKERFMNQRPVSDRFTQTL